MAVAAEVIQINSRENSSVDDKLYQLNKILIKIAFSTMMSSEIKVRSLNEILEKAIEVSISYDFIQGISTKNYLAFFNSSAYNNPNNVIYLPLSGTYLSTVATPKKKWRPRTNMFISIRNFRMSSSIQKLYVLFFVSGSVGACLSGLSAYVYPLFDPNVARVLLPASIIFLLMTWFDYLLRGKGSA